MVDELLSVINYAAGSYADEDRGLGVVWNGSRTFNVLNLYTGERVAAFSVEDVPTVEEAAEHAREYMLTNEYL